jgi:hypothetical protein
MLLRSFTSARNDIRFKSFQNRVVPRLSRQLSRQLSPLPRHLSPSIADSRSQPCHFGAARVHASALENYRFRATPRLALPRERQYGVAEEPNRLLSHLRLYLRHGLPAIKVRAPRTNSSRGNAQGTHTHTQSERERERESRCNKGPRLEERLRYAPERDYVLSRREARGTRGEESHRTAGISTRKSKYSGGRIDCNSALRTFRPQMLVSAIDSLNA